MVTVSGRSANGETYCLAHHLCSDESESEEPDLVDKVQHLRYLDDFELGDGHQWWITRRLVEVDWMETRRIGRQEWS